MTITLQILCDGIPCGVPLSESAARAWLEFVQHVAPETAKAMLMAMRDEPRGWVAVGAPIRLAR